MKRKIIIYVAVSFLLQSCFSYKSLDLMQSPLKIGKIYKVKQEDKFVIAKLKAQNDSILTFVINKKQTQIYTTNIKEIKAQKFSVLKTIGLTAGTVGVLTLVALISLSTSDSNFDFSDVTLPN